LELSNASCLRSRLCDGATARALIPVHGLTGRNIDCWALEAPPPALSWRTKNHYGSRSERGTRVAALFYSLIESAKLAGVEPRAYLRQATLRAVRHPGTATLARDLKSSRSWRRNQRWTGRAPRGDNGRGRVGPVSRTHTTRLPPLPPDPGRLAGSASTRSSSRR
jgi:hypothetical protein